MSSAESPPQDLGRAQIEPNGRLSLPDDLAEWDVLSPGGEAYWAFDPSNDRLVVTRSQRALDEHADLNRFDATDVTDEGDVALPESVLDDGDRPWSEYFEPGDTCSFGAPGDLLRE